MDVRPILEQKKVPELRKLARDLEVVDRPRMKKPDLVDSLLACEGIAAA
ncbi:MAG: Rho termination factor N-terminal domain-containing protein [Acidobacteriota bacterium]|nr:Rho termination factor N-terminal domain-containing protein [Acidobacteriota bacterium]